jgi:hypothetical protein
VRSSNVLPAVLGSTVIAALKQYESSLMAGALVVVDETTSRVRVLPLR